MTLVITGLAPAAADAVEAAALLPRASRGAAPGLTGGNSRSVYFRDLDGDRPFALVMG